MTPLDVAELKRLELLKYRWATVDTKGYAVLSQWATFARDASGALFGFVSGAGWPEMAHQLSDELTLILGQLPALIVALESVPELGIIEELRQQVQRISGLAAEARAGRDLWRQHTGRVEAALVELVRRASDPDIEATAVGARIMLDEALKDAAVALAAAPDLSGTGITIEEFVARLKAAAPAPGEVKGDG